MVRSVLLHIYIPECFILLLSISRVLIRVFVSGLWNFVMIISSWTLLWILSPWKNQSTSSGACSTPVALQDRRIASPWSTNSAPDSVRAEIRMVSLSIFILYFFCVWAGFQPLLWKLKKMFSFVLNFFSSKTRYKSRTSNKI